MNCGLVVVDVSNPDQPEEVYRVAKPQSWSNVLLADQYLIGTTVNTSPNRDGFEDIRSLRLFELSNPIEPKLLSFLKMDYNAQEIAIRDQYLFYPDSLVQQEQAQDGKPKLRVFDLSTPKNLQSVSEVDTSQTCPVVMAAQISGNVLYLGDNSRGICVYDISNPFSPTFVNRIEGVAPVRDIAIGNGSLFVAAWSSVAVFDLGDPFNPELKDTIITPGLFLELQSNQTGLYLLRIRTMD